MKQKVLSYFIFISKKINPTPSLAMLLDSKTPVKALLLVLFIFILKSNSSAQNTVQFGVKAGMNVSTLNYKNVGDSYDPRVSYHGGVFLNARFDDKWSLQPEALASKEGFNDNNSEQRWRILYLNFPVMLQYAFAKRFAVEAGPEFGFRLRARVANSGSEFVSATSAYNQLNFSAAAGISYLSKYNVGIGARYTKGITDITQGSYNYVATNVAQLSVFYLIKRLHRK
jgi:hypothetical protein